MQQLRTKANREHSEAWDRWYGTLPDDLKRRLSVHDFHRLGECFRKAFRIEKVEGLAAPGDVTQLALAKKVIKESRKLLDRGCYLKGTAQWLREALAEYDRAALPKPPVTPSGREMTDD